jgi:hypothetical protein
MAAVAASFTLELQDLMNRFNQQDPSDVDAVLDLADECYELLDRIEQHPELQVNWSVQRLELEVMNAMLDKLLQAIEFMAN